jgi:hypothetical protein
MRSANGGRSQHSPFRIVPERGQVSEDNVEPSTSESWGVFHEDELRSNLANDASHLPPESGPLSAEAGALTRDGDVLTREPSGDDVDDASPLGPVECPDVVPDGERLEASIVLSRHEDGSGVLVPLDSANSTPSENPPAEDASSSARE